MLLLVLHLQLGHNVFLLWLYIFCYRMLISNHLCSKWVGYLNYSYTIAALNTYVFLTPISNNCCISFGIIKCEPFCGSVTCFIFLILRNNSWRFESQYVALFWELLDFRSSRNSSISGAVAKMEQTDGLTF